MDRRSFFALLGKLGIAAAAAKAAPALPEEIPTESGVLPWVPIERPEAWAPDLGPCPALSGALVAEETGFRAERMLVTRIDVEHLYDALTRQSVVCECVDGTGTRYEVRFVHLGYPLSPLRVGDLIEVRVGWPHDRPHAPSIEVADAGGRVDVRAESFEMSAYHPRASSKWTS